MNKFKLNPRMCQFALPAGNHKLMHEMTIPFLGCFVTKDIERNGHNYDKHKIHR